MHRLYLARLLALSMFFAAPLLAAHGEAPAPVVEVDPRVELIRRGIQFREHEIEGLRVLEVVAGVAPFDAELPLVMRIHGRGDSAQLPEGNHLGAEHPVRLILPEAPAEFARGYSWSPVSVTETEERARLTAALDLHAAKLAAVLRHFREIREVVGEPIVTGFSQGGMLTMTLAMQHPNSVGVALPIAGYLPDALVPRRLRPGHRYPAVHMVHGEADRIVRPEPTRALSERLQRLGLDASFQSFAGARHEVTPEMRRAYRALLDEAIRAQIDAVRPAV